MAVWRPIDFAAPRMRRENAACRSTSPPEMVRPPFIAPMRNVEWVEVQPFHQMGAFKWKAMNLEYKLDRTQAPAPELLNRVLEQFRAAGCRAR